MASEPGAKWEGKYMHAAVRPYVMSSIALAAAGAVAAAPVTFERAAVEVSSRMVRLTASPFPPTPADIYPRLLADTTENAELLIGALLANPAPVLQQLISDPVTSIQNLPALAAQLPNLALISGLSVIGPPAATVLAAVVSASYTQAALLSGDPAQLLEAVAATPGFVAYGFLNGGWGPDLEPTNADLYFLAGGMLTQLDFAFVSPKLFIQIPGPLGLVPYVQQTVADTLSAPVMLTAAKQGAAPEEALSDGPVTETLVAPKNEKLREPLLTNAAARLDGVLNAWQDRAAGASLTTAGGTDLSDGNLAVPGETKLAGRPGQRIRSVVKQVREQLQSAVKKLGDSVSAAVGAGNSTAKDVADTDE